MQTRDSGVVPPDSHPALAAPAAPANSPHTTTPTSGASKADSQPEAPASIDPIAEFDDMGLSEDLLRGVYGYGFEKPSMVQQSGIPPFAAGRDVIVQAQSGTGKTATFGIALLSRLDTSARGAYTQAIVLSPTRELAQQSHLVCAAIGDRMGVQPYLAIGGSAVARGRGASDAIRRSHVVIGTPGRVFHLLSSGAIDGGRVRMLVLDEADELLQAGHGDRDGFIDQVAAVYAKLTLPALQVGLFSATLPAEALSEARRMTRDAVEVLVKADELTLEGISQFYVALDDDAWKLDTLIDLYGTLSIGQSIIYVASQRRAEQFAHELTAQDFAVSVIHGGLSPEERQGTMRDFRVGNTRVLIATDLLARGIDVQGVSVVMNVDMPVDKEKYLHRIGRSGRFGRKGVAINLVTRRDAGIMRAIEGFYETRIEEMPQNVADFL